jgi:hypothetical protein
MVKISIEAEGATVGEALNNLAALVRFEHGLHALQLKGGCLILDGVARPVRKGGNVIGSVTASGSDEDKALHYTGRDHRPQRRQPVSP